MRIDEVEAAIQYLKSHRLAHSLEELDGCACILDLEQFVHRAGRLTRTLQNPTIQATGQQVNVGAMRHEAAAAVLMMTAERHLPSGERHEYDSILPDQTPYLAQETLLVGDMLDHVVAHHHVEPCRALLHLEEVLADEAALQSLRFETLLGSHDVVRVDVNTRHLASACCYGCQVAAHAATYLQYTRPFVQGVVLFDVGDKVLLARPRQFVEILLSCDTSYWHYLIFAAKIRRKTEYL